MLVDAEYYYLYRNYFYLPAEALKNALSRQIGVSWATVGQVTRTKQLFLSSLIQDGDYTLTIMDSANQWLVA